MSRAKEIVGVRACDFVEDGMVVGLGTGSTVSFFIKELGKRIKERKINNVVGIPASKETELLARSVGISLSTLDRTNRIDLLVDGVDEVTTQFNGIKGGSGALLREKIVATNSNKVIWIADESKLVNELGAGGIPVEVVQFGSFNLFRLFDQNGWRPTFRKSGQDSLYITVSGNYIIDLHINPIENLHKLQFDLNYMVGVVEHGLFLNHPDVILIGKEEGKITRYQRKMVDNESDTTTKEAP